MSQNETHASSFEQLYLKERKKAWIFMNTTAVAAVLAVGLLVYAVNKKTEAPEPAALGENGPRMQFDGEDGPGGRMQMRMDVTQFLNDDGSVDTDRVNDMLERLPDNFREDMLGRMETQIDEAVSDDDITQDQATALKSAFGISGDTNEKT